MPFIATHILVVIILIELFRKYWIKSNKKFPRYYIFIATIGAILPDFDFVIYYIGYFFGFTINQIHRTFLHTFFIPIALFLIGLGVYKLGIKYEAFWQRHITLSTTFFILAAGSLIHLLLDFGISGKIMPFYPLATYTIGYDIRALFPEDWKDIIFPTIDAVLLLFWIFWLNFKLKIDDYF